MPARKTVPREVILSCAMELLETEGSGALNARSLAKRLGCSTQPIYLSFAGMDDLRGELLERCRMIQEGYIAREPEETLFLRATLGFLRFVYEKPNLFRFVYFENPFRNTEGDRAFIDATVTGIMQAGGYRSRSVAKRFYYATWFFMYGIAVQLVYGFMSPKWEDIRRMLNDEFEAFKRYYKEMDNKNE